MPRYRVSFDTSMWLEVTLDADDQEQAEDYAWDLADAYLQTLWGDGREVLAEASLDGIGATSCEEIEENEE
jgi:hypothetical protein